MHDKIRIPVKSQFLITISIIVIIIVFFVPTIEQKIEYHNFIDYRLLIGIPNFFNVVSNVPFLVIGIFGIFLLRETKKVVILESNKTAYYVFFSGIVLIAFGSAYYHWNPSNQTLVWDRLPMTIAFSAYFSIILSEFISEKLGRKAFIPILAIGIFSVWYWYYTELQNAGDLRLYGLVQFLPMLLIPLILLMYRSCFTKVKYFWYFILLYILAKIAETYDMLIYEYLVVISGHTIKHILASGSCIIFYYQIKNRQLASD